MAESAVEKDIFLIDHPEFKLCEEVAYPNGGSSRFYDNGKDMIIIDKDICTHEKDDPAFRYMLITEKQNQYMHRFQRVFRFLGYDQKETDHYLSSRESDIQTTDVAHELRTPLMAIQATVEAMVDGVFEPNEEHLETVNSEVQRLSRLVDSLLKLSRLENRSNPLKTQIVDVGDLVDGIVATHAAFVAEAGLELHSEVAHYVFVKGDPDMIRQATANLISNAVRYTPEGGHVWVRVRKGEIMASISVEDTGIGLTPEEAKMVFSRFWRADAGRTRERGGLGIGLSVVKEIVERHGGWVQVEGEKDEGARFTIHIPLYSEEREKSQRAKDAKARKSQRASRSGKIRLPR